MTTVARGNGPLNKIALGEAVAAELGTSHEKGHEAVTAVLNVIARTVAAGYPVAVSNFGTFAPKQEAEHMARNPQTGALVTVPARSWLRFRPSPQLQDAVKAGDWEAAVITKRSRH
ncbi:HU family DNA-binding protein [Streptomyces sp. NPDC094153]|uniref:HU family DNA-binding protein n=1 Tax=Streptomyces sp. NPDC094153 TaxID=3366058 RepID=UPI0037FE8393